MLKKTKKFIALAVCINLAVSSLAVTKVNSSVVGDTSLYKEAFFDLYKKIHDPENGYFSKEGIPYYSPETFILESVDYGHETTSETFSYYLKLEAMYGKLSGDWSGYNKAWDTLVKYAIPSKEEQPNSNKYNTAKPSYIFKDGKMPDLYPINAVTADLFGKDPLHNELASTYGHSTMFGMQNLLDTDNWHRFGNMGNGTSKASKINPPGRGEQESIWETVMTPAWEVFKWGNTENGGFQSLVFKQDKYFKRWLYNANPSDDAAAVQAAFYANKWATEQGKQSQVSDANSKASMLGDYLRYGLIDKNMTPIASSSMRLINDGSDAIHYLISNKYSWSGPIADEGVAYKNGSNDNLQGNQNPMAAYALSNVNELKPKSPRASSHWNKSLERQLELFKWLQSEEGAIAGGCTSISSDENTAIPASSSIFYGMIFDTSPGLKDPPSSRYFGDQCASMSSLAQYFYETGDERAYKILKKWVNWVYPNVNITNNGFTLPSDLSWSGQPDSWNGSTAENKNLHVVIDNFATDLTSAAALVNTLVYYSAATKVHKVGSDEYAGYLAEKLLGAIAFYHADDKGFSCEEQRGDYSRFYDQVVYIPNGWSGITPQGAILKPGIKFFDTRPAYKQDPSFQQVESSYWAGVGPKFKYHRFSTQCEIALALGARSIYMIDTSSPTSPAFTPTPTPKYDWFLTGDLNKDGIVNMADVMFIIPGFGKSIGDPEYNPEADLNKDGVINMGDVIILANSFGKVAPKSGY